MFNLADAFIALSHRWPSRPAVISGSETLSWAQLIARCSCLARLLVSNDVRPGDRVGVALTTNLDTLVAMIALWMIGGTSLVADFRSRAAERKKLSDALNLKFYLEDRPAPGTEPYQSFRLARGWAEDAVQSVPITSAVVGNRLAAIGISSGTMGMPQPVALTHDCLFARYCLARVSPQWNPGGRLVVSAPLAFSATRKHVLSRLLDGGTVVFSSLLVNAQELADLIESSGATAMLTVPAVARGLMKLASGDGVLFPRLDYMMCCGAPMTPDEKIDALRLLSNGFVQNYGTTMAGMVTVLESREVMTHSTTVGRPLAHVTVEVVDQDGRVLPTGEVGTIRVRTPGVAEDIDHSGDERRQSDLVVDGWIYPGDIVALDQGFLTIIGRSTDVIIRGGVNVYPNEVEAIIQKHPDVIEAAVVGWADPILGEEVAAFVTVRNPVEPREILSICNRELHPDKQPRQVFIIDAMPQSANGKLVRRELLSLLPERLPKHDPAPKGIRTEFGIPEAY